MKSFDHHEAFHYFCGQTSTFQEASYFQNGEMPGVFSFSYGRCANSNSIKIFVHPKSFSKVITHKTHGARSPKCAFTAEQQGIMNALGANRSNAQNLVNR